MCVLVCSLSTACKLLLKKPSVLATVLGARAKSICVRVCARSEERGKGGARRCFLPVAEAAPATLAGATVLYVLGVVLMMASDAQKFFTLKVRRGLITDGFFARVRHPNYLGEMMLYASFAVVAGHWIPWVVLAWVWGGVFVPNMLRKEASMARHPGWAAYRARTGFLLPRFGRSDEVTVAATGTEAA